MYAVIATGGKQYRVKTDDVIKVELIGGEVGDKVDFTDVLAIESEKETKIGTPKVQGAKVQGEILDIFRDKKVVTFKMKRRKGYRNTHGHRQDLMKIKIVKVEA